MTPHDTQTLINQLLLNPKILQISTFYPHDCLPYAAVQFQGRNKEVTDILVIIPDLHLLRGRISISPTGNFRYIRINNGKYLHQLILQPAAGFVCHHMHADYVADCRRDFMQVLDLEEHSRFHAIIRPRTKRTANRDNSAVLH